MFLLLGDDSYLALGDGPPARLLLGEDFPQGWIDVSGPVRVSLGHLEFTSEQGVLGITNDSPQAVED